MGSALSLGTNGLVFLSGVVAGSGGGGLSIDAVGLLSERSVYNSEPEGFVFLATDNGNLYVREGAPPGWSAAIPFVGPPGPAGPAIEIRTTATHIQWRVVGDPTWIDLVALSAISGSDGNDGDDGDNGQNIELQTTATHIQWRVVGSPTWTNLVALSTLTGEAGQNIELQTTATHIQWRVVGDPSWINLVALSAISGSDGNDGNDGQNIELQTTATHIQWRVVGTPTWANLVALSTLTGEAGASGVYGPIACHITAANTAAATGIVPGFPMLFDATLTGLFVVGNPGPSGANFICQVRQGGTNILSTALSIDAGEVSSLTAAVPPVISNSTLTRGSWIDFNITQVGVAPNQGQNFVVVFELAAP